MNLSRKSQRPRSFWPVLFWCCGLVMLLLGELAVALMPDQLPWLALFGMAYPLSSIVFLIGTLGAWGVRRWKLGLIGLLVISGLSSHYTSTWGGWKVSRSQGSEVTTLRVLTWNVRQFNRYAWIEKPHVRDSILAYLARQEADIICLQECFLEERRQPWMSAERLKQATGLTHWQEEFKLGRGQDKLFGLAVLSRFPIVAKEAIRFDNDKNNSAMSVDVVVEGDTVRVYNVHLSSIGFEKEDYEESIASYTKAINIADLGIYYNNRGLANFYVGLLDVARKDFDLAISKNPEDVTIYLNRGNMYMSD